MIRWNVTPEEHRLIEQIALRASDIGYASNRRIDRTDLVMDLTATHGNGNPLQLAALLSAREFDFVHDVWGIMRHIDRETGKLQNCFSPRYSA